MTRFPLIRWLACSALLLAASAALVSGARAQEAKPFLHPLFTDNMVLQRGTADPVWGWATPGSAVVVRVAGKSAKATAGADGKWTARVGPLAAGGPYTLTVSGERAVTLKNVLVGDVWLCSGQSNMQFGVQNLADAKEEIARANHPKIRLFSVPLVTGDTPRALVSGSWQVCTPETIQQGSWGGFSAVAYFFGRDLQKALGVPIGLIHSSWGGTPAEAWTSAEALDRLPDFHPVITAQAQARQDPNGFAQRIEAWYAKHDPGSAPAAPTPAVSTAASNTAANNAADGGAPAPAAHTWADPALDTSGWKTMRLPTAWERSGAPEMAVFDGVVWFRREFDLPAAWAGKDLTLHLGPIDDRDTTYVNGRAIGGLNDYQALRDYKIPAADLKPGRNVLAVRVLDTGGEGGLDGKPEQMRLEAPGAPAVSLAGAWLYKIGAPLPAGDPAPSPGGGDQNTPTFLYNAMIAPLVPFGMKGAIWYQGEANVGRARQYQALLPAMIGDWRGRFGGPFPYLIVQLANFLPAQPEPGESAWAELREAQARTARRVPRAGLAVAIDIGEAGDIHPKNKQEVGRRLALAAEAVAYGKPVEDSGPIFVGMTVSGSAATLRFGHAAGGLVAKGGGPLKGFAVAGPDGRFVWADARIAGDTVVVSAPSVSAPADVRYAWADNPVCNLYNKAGLPAVPFRTGR